MARRATRFLDIFLRVPMKNVVVIQKLGQLLIFPFYFFTVFEPSHDGGCIRKERHLHGNFWWNATINVGFPHWRWMDAQLELTESIRYVLHIRRVAWQNIGVLHSYSFLWTALQSLQRRFIPNDVLASGALALFQSGASSIHLCVSCWISDCVGGEKVLPMVERGLMCRCGLSIPLTCYIICRYMSIM